jgi:hypothetical protein
VRIAVYDTRGRELWASTLTGLPPGDHVLPWARRDQHGGRVARGIYFVRLEVAGTVAVRKLPLLR